MAFPLPLPLFLAFFLLHAVERGLLPPSCVAQPRTRDLPAFISPRRNSPGLRESDVTSLVDIRDGSFKSAIQDTDYFRTCPVPTAQNDFRWVITRYAWYGPQLGACGTKGAGMYLQR